MFDYVIRLKNNTYCFGMLPMAMSYSSSKDIAGLTIAPSLMALELMEDDMVKHIGFVITSIYVESGSLDMNTLLQSYSRV